MVKMVHFVMHFYCNKRKTNPGGSSASPTLSAFFTDSRDICPVSHHYLFGHHPFIRGDLTQSWMLLLLSSLPLPASLLPHWEEGEPWGAPKQS